MKEQKEDIDTGIEMVYKPFQNITKKIKENY